MIRIRYSCKQKEIYVMKQKRDLYHIVTSKTFIMMLYKTIKFQYVKKEIYDNLVDIKSGTL